VLDRVHRGFGAAPADLTLNDLRSKMRAVGVEMPGGSAKAPFVEAAETWLSARPDADFEVSWRGALGDVLTFRSLLEDGSTDLKTLHAGAPVASGWKALASLWLRERAVGPEGVAVRR
jgi:hypothetical protein